MKKYRYSIDCMTHQVLYQTVEFETDHRLSDKEIEEQVDDRLDERNWEPQRPSKQVDIDHIQVTELEEEEQEL